MANELTELDLVQLKKTLEELREDLRKDLDTAKETSKPVSLDSPIGRVSRMDAIAQQQMAAATRRRTQDRLHRVQSALSRMADSSYGHCLRCEEPIELKRLSIQPETLFCHSCQTGSEG